MATDGPKPLPLVDVERFRQRAAEARAMAENFRDPGVRKGMLDIAATYDRLADGAEWHIARNTKTETD
jgi:hypothetical protein